MHLVQLFGGCDVISFYLFYGRSHSKTTATLKPINLIPEHFRKLYTFVSGILYSFPGGKIVWA
jgi:hypothetical protein